MSQDQHRFLERAGRRRRPASGAILRNFGRAPRWYTQYQNEPGDMPWVPDGADGRLPLADAFKAMDQDLAIDILSEIRIDYHRQEERPASGEHGLDVLALMGIFGGADSSCEDIYDAAEARCRFMLEYARRHRIAFAQRWEPADGAFFDDPEKPETPQSLQVRTADGTPVDREDAVRLMKPSTRRCIMIRHPIHDQSFFEEYARQHSRTDDQGTLVTDPWRPAGEKASEMLPVWLIRERSRTVER